MYRLGGLVLHPDGKLMPKRQGRLIGLAGWLAELVCDDEEIDAEDIADLVELGFAADAMLETDMAMCAGFTQCNIGEALALVRNAWLEIEHVASLLIAESGYRHGPEEPRSHSL
jgi:hypothetical protein